LNTASPWGAQAAGALASAGIPIPDSWRNAQAGTEEVEYNKAILNPYVVRQSGVAAHAQGVDLRNLTKYGGGFTGPAANFDKVVKMDALAERERDFAHDLITKGKTQADPDAWAEHWAASHPITKYIEKSAQQYKFHAGMTKGQINQYIPETKNVTAADFEKMVENGVRYVRVAGKPYQLVKTKSGIQPTEIGE